MAKILKRDNSLKKEYNTLKKRKKADFIVFAVLFAVSIISTGVFLINSADQNYYIAPIILLVASIVFLFKCIFKTNDIEILEAGIDGENIAKEIIRQLPDNYFCFTNVEVSFSGKSEIDMVVVGPSGVFIIETKNMRGNIYADLSKEKWLQDKISRGGNIYTKQFYSPIKQVGTHTYRLHGYLKEKSINVYIKPIVLFVNKEASLCLNGTSETPVFSVSDNGKALLKEYILNNNSRLSSEKIKAICRLL